jgi:hypothetical protein
MQRLTRELMEYMVKWSGKSGPLLLVNVMKKTNVSDLEHISIEDKERILNAMTCDYLSTFLAHNKFIMARAELVSILGISEESYRINDRNYRAPVTPNLLGKPVP